MDENKQSGDDQKPSPLKHADAERVTGKEAEGTGGTGQREDAPAGEDAPSPAQHN
jgi:hypothetical protein